MPMQITFLASLLGENTILSDMLSRLERPTYVNEKTKQNKKKQQLSHHLQRKNIKGTNYGAEQRIILESRSAQN